MVAMKNSPEMEALLDRSQPVAPPCDPVLKPPFDSAVW